MARGESASHIHLRNRVLSIVWVTIALGILSTFVVYFLERHAEGTQIHEPLRRLPLLHVAAPHRLLGRQRRAPTPGKVLELFFDIYAITVVATLAGSFGAFFHQRSEEREQAKAAAEAGS